MKHCAAPSSIRGRCARCRGEGILRLLTTKCACLAFYDIVHAVGRPWDVLA